jgi:hypothetical protein
MGKQMGVSKGIYSLDNFFGNSLFDSYASIEEILEIEGYRLKAYITEFFLYTRGLVSGVF